MSDFFNAVKAGIQGAREGMGPGRYTAAGRLVSCMHCGEQRFEKREAQMNTSGMTMLGLDWLNRSAAALVCTGCGLIQWFAAAPERLDD